MFKKNEKYFYLNDIFHCDIKMNLLTNDEWGYIMRFIEGNNDKYNLLRTCKQMGNCNFYFYGPVQLMKITKSIWFNNFINIDTNDLTFDYLFNQPIKDCIPLGVTHLTFGSRFNQPINDCIPSSVTHLTFGYYFNQPIKDCIPPSVKYLEFNGKYRHPIENYMIPDIIVNGINIKKNEK